MALGAAWQLDFKGVRSYQQAWKAHWNRPDLWVHDEFYFNREDVMDSQERFEVAIHVERAERRKFLARFQRRRHKLLLEYSHHKLTFMPSRNRVVVLARRMYTFNALEDEITEPFTQALADFAFLNIVIDDVLAKWDDQAEDKAEESSLTARTSPLGTPFAKPEPPLPVKPPLPYKSPFGQTTPANPFAAKETSAPPPPNPFLDTDEFEEITGVPGNAPKPEPAKPSPFSPQIPVVQKATDDEPTDTVEIAEIAAAPEADDATRPAETAVNTDSSDEVIAVPAAEKDGAVQPKAASDAQSETEE